MSEEIYTADSGREYVQTEEGSFVQVSRTPYVNRRPNKFWKRKIRYRSQNKIARARERRDRSRRGESEKSAEETLMGMTKAELVAFAEDREIEVNPSWVTDAIIHEIQKALDGDSTGS